MPLPGKSKHEICTTTFLFARCLQDLTHDNVTLLSDGSLKMSIYHLFIRSLSLIGQLWCYKYHIK